MNPYYVLLTGSKNNAGDYLIKYRAKQLLTRLRQDRELIDLDRFNPLTDQQLELINSSKALILTGGPALKYDMYPEIYPLRENLDEIKVPIICMGLGYKDPNGEWYNAKKYKFSPKSHILLDRISHDGFLSSVRDYNTLNSLRFSGYKNFIMTGCPALYEPDFFTKEVEDMPIKKVNFSLGVTYLQGGEYYFSMLKVVKALKLFFKDEHFQVLFHHSIDTSVDLQRKMINYLEKHQIAYKDISGSEQGLLEEYENCDLHIGYRVHAHIFMSSISKRSILISEDGRGKGLNDVIGGVKLESYRVVDNNNLLNKFKNKINKSYHFHKAIEDLESEVLNAVLYEFERSFHRTKKIRSNINQAYEEMKVFIEQLP